jgi:hypothetical protein
VSWPSVQREDEQIARVLEVVVFHGMLVTAARLHSEVLLRADRVDHRRTFQRRTDVDRTDHRRPKCLALLYPYPITSSARI